MNIRTYFGGLRRDCWGIHLPTPSVDHKLLVSEDSIFRVWAKSQPIVAQTLATGKHAITSDRCCASELFCLHPQRGRSHIYS